MPAASRQPIARPKALSLTVGTDSSGGVAEKDVPDAEHQAWDALRSLSPPDVCRQAAVSYDATARLYCCPSLGQRLTVDPQKRAFGADSVTGQLLIGHLAYFSHIMLLHYLVHARGVPLAGRLIATSELVSSQLYAAGTHVLPTDRLAAAYGPCPERFLQRAAELGGQRLSYGDASVSLPVLPRVPVTVVLWQGDEEFGPRASLLLDATCQTHLAPDIVWAAAMTSLLLLLS